MCYNKQKFNNLNNLLKNRKLIICLKLSPNFQIINLKTNNVI